MEKGCHLRGTGIHIKAAEVCVFALLRVLQTLIFSLFFSMWRRSLFSHPPPRQPPLSYRSVLQLGSLSSATEMCLRNTPSHPHVSTLPQNETLHWQDWGDSSGEIWKSPAMTGEEWCSDTNLDWKPLHPSSPGQLRGCDQIGYLRACCAVTTSNHSVCFHESGCRGYYPSW